MSRGVPWQKFYLGSLVLSGLNTTFLVFAYQPTLSEINNDRIQASPEASNVVSSYATLPLPQGPQSFWSSRNSSIVHPRSSTLTSFVNGSLNHACCDTAMRQALHDPLVWAFAVFQGLYSGRSVLQKCFSCLN